MLEGDLIVEGSGDLSLANEKLWFLCTDIARIGIKEVKGDLVLNTSLFGAIEPDQDRAAGAAFSTYAYDSEACPSSPLPAPMGTALARLCPSYSYTSFANFWYICFLFLPWPGPVTDSLPCRHSHHRGAEHLSKLPAVCYD